MSKFGLIAWSFNRAAQLDLLLSSVERFAPDQFDIFVLYKSVGEFIEGYNLCKSYHPKVNFVSETNFCEQTKDILAEREYFGVSTDDTVVFRPFELDESLMNNVDIFSLRYGLNTTLQDPFTNIYQPALSMYFDEGDTISWDSRLYHPLNNYGFLFGHDMHIYSKRYREIIAETNFKKTNELESWLFNNARHKINPIIRSFKHSVAINIPANNTSGCTETDNSLPLEEVNAKFIAGKRFDITSVLNTKIIGCHQLVDLNMV